MKKFIPFWFWDVTVTEKKLSQLHSKGYHLKAFSPILGMFTFDEGDKCDVLYRICSLKNCDGKAPKGVEANGWVSACGSKNLYIAYNHDTETKNIPSYKFWQTFNRVAILITIFVFCFLLGFLLGFGSSSVEHGRFVLNQLKFIGTAVIEIALLILLICGWKANKNLSKTSTDLGLNGFIKTIPQENFIYTKEEEKQMLKSGQMIRKVPLGWFYAPDTAEKMVEEMALKGWKFYRFDEMGMTFHFIKSQPCKLKFVVDYQSEASDDYYLQGKDDGWKLEFTSMTRTMCFVVWSKEYSKDDECPEFYTDNATMLKRAQRMAFTFGIPMMLFAIFALVFSVIMIISELIWLVPIYLMIAGEFGLFGSRAFGFYLRMRKKHKKNNS